MDMKKEDFILIQALDGKKVLALRPDYFDKQPIEEIVKEAMEEKKEVEIIVEPEPEPTEEELAEIEKEKKKAELKAQLEALE